MSYYQLISLKLQLGIDPDASIDHRTLLKMWKTHHRTKSAAVKTAIREIHHSRPEVKVHNLP